MERLIKFLQLEEGILRTPKVIQAMQSVDRKDFVPDVHSFPSSIPFFILPLLMMIVLSQLVIMPPYQHLICTPLPWKLYFPIF